MKHRLLLILALLVPLGLATKFYSGPAEAWVHGHAGGLLYVTFWCLLVLAIWPRFSATAVAVGVFLVTSVLEFSQLWHPPPLEMVRSTFLGHALIGSTFSWSDFPYYGAGALTAVYIARICTSRSCCQI